MMKAFMKFAVPAALAAALCAANVSADDVIKAGHEFDLADDDFADGTYHIGFNMDSFRDEDDFIADMYTSLYYDIVTVANLKAGDVIEGADGADITIETIEQDGDTIEINGGTPYGGLTLKTTEDTNGWYAYSDEVPAYLLLGQAELEFADTVTLNIYSMDDKKAPTGGYDKMTVTEDEVKSTLESLGLFDYYDPVRTCVDLQDDDIVEITISYAP